MYVVECKGLAKEYKYMGLAKESRGMSMRAIDNLTFSIEENKITGLIGRNGAGKTTLLKIIAGYYDKTRGEVTVFSEDPFNNLKVSSNMIYIDEQMSFPNALNLSEILSSADTFYENWDRYLAEGLFEYFGLHPKHKHHNLSKGMRSTFNMIIGLAARCPLTIMDEPTSGMDASVRKDFYRALLKDYIEHPRTIIISSHLLNEIEDVLEDVLLVRHGNKKLHMSVADLKVYAVGLTGNKDILEDYTKNKEIIHIQEVGDSQQYVVVINDFPESLLQQAKRAGVVVTSVATDDLCVYLTAKSKGGIDDVFARKI